MKTTEFEEMLDLLKEATLSGKLEWSATNNSKFSFSAIVNGCTIIVSNFYDPVGMSNKVTIELLNSSGDSFKKNVYSQTVKPERYDQIKELYNAIRDRYYRITESELLILSGLRNLADDKGEPSKGDQ